ncbi:MAG: hypothetical protein IKO41_18455 [Lachnospiraceae bacterium]|nr:hypothetical protein [Lachnospiraceae bacterium]
MFRKMAWVSEPEEGRQDRVRHAGKQSGIAAGVTVCRESAVIEEIVLRLKWQGQICF